MTAAQSFRVSGAIASLAVKAPCAAVTNANITLLGAQTVNSVAVVAGDRVLVKDQTDATENGIYDVKATAWSRSADFDGARDVVQGTLIVVVTSGVSGEAIFYQVTTANPITIGTTEITISDFAAALGSINADSFATGFEPITIVTSVPGTLSTQNIFNTTDGRLYYWNGSAYVRTIPTTDLTGTIGTTQIADDSISTPKLKANSVTANEIAATTITAAEIASNAITADKILAGEITAAKVNSSFFNGKTFTGGIFQTRSETIPSPATNRAVMSSAGFQLFDEANNLLFDVDENGKVSIQGEFVAGTIDDASMFSAAGLAALRALLGVTAITSPTGGLYTKTALPASVLSSPTNIVADTPDSGVISHLSGNTVSLSAKLTEWGYYAGEASSLSWTAPVYTVRFYRGVSPYTYPGNYTALAAATTLTGTATNTHLVEGGDDLGWHGSINLNATATDTDDPATGDYKYLAVVTYSSGTQNAPACYSFQASEALAGGLAIADLSFSSVTEVSAQDHTATGATSGATVKDHGGTARDIGYNTLSDFNYNASDVLEASHAGAMCFTDNTTAYTLTLAASSSLDFPVDAVTQVVNAGTSGDYTITEGASTTLYYITPGTGRVDTAGGCTIGPGGVASIWRQSATVYYIWGSEITA